MLRAEQRTVVGTPARAALDRALKRSLDVAMSAFLLAILSPLIVAVAVAIKLDSRGPVFYRCRRVGYRGREFAMLKFRKMVDGARGSALTAADDTRFTTIGGFLAKTKLDEIPQLWNVLKGEMSLIGPRPEDPGFTELERERYERILSVRPGVTGLSQLAFAKESAILDRDDPVGHYARRIFPQKVRLDTMYAQTRSIGLDLAILWWTAVAVLLRRDVAVNRSTGELTLRRPRSAADLIARRQGVQP